MKALTIELLLACLLAANVVHGRLSESALAFEEGGELGAKSDMSDGVWIEPEVDKDEVRQFIPLCHQSHEELNLICVVGVAARLWYESMSRTRLLANDL